ncbi:hypothetical protein KEX41_28155 (plasmid) [Burkholderia thailandensis]|uniref:hypothetical protein n=1 Tax=Burkholderia thailandensis TaxID=57975 RepID=UPI00192DDA92|nr:hypothetical protein [Burkholderia thailandensis]MBS2132063.1 hypothetical protein [Burkholderia thailandensis]QRA15177.1 hypothetical protein JMY07_30190 [Burkholderia thailandensis]
MASWPGMRHEDATSLLVQRHVEPLFGALSTEHVQLVPQSFGTLTDAIADGLLAMFPSVRFRLHANVRVMRTHQVADLSNFGQHREWFARAAQVSQRLHAPAYSAHAGRRSHASLAVMLDNARRCADLFECPVAVEGQYPSKGDALLVSGWAEYRMLFESGVPYALDLSHLNIVAQQSRSRDDGFVAEMLTCERCIEVHVSDNDGTGDWHQVCDREPWWYGLLAHVHPGAILFSEGNHRYRRTIR